MRAEGQGATGGVERGSTVQGVSSERQSEQYSLAKILGIWALATVPMGVLGWIVFPLLAPDSGSDPLGFGVTRLVLIMLGLIWLWVVPFLVAVAAVELVLDPPIENAWVWVFPFLAEPGSYSFDANFGSQEILQRLEGAWWFFALFVVQAAFNTILGEEFLFRGVLLPRMEGVFGRWSWVANSVLFGLYHVHQPWGIPNSVLTGLLYTFPAYRYRSTWMSIILHSAQSVFFAFLVLAVVLGL